MAVTTPKPQSIQGPPSLWRQPVTFLSPASLTGSQWRQFLGGAPVVRAAVQTLIMQTSGLDWYLEGDDDDAKAYFTKLLESYGGPGWEVGVSRVTKDMLELPFGGATEIGHFGDGVVAWITHIDGGTMVPTYNERYPYAQVDPFMGRQVIPFRPESIGRVRWQAQSDLRSYEWTITPVMDCLPAIQGLLRADQFWQGFLLDNPPSGILDIPGFDEKEAREWYESWQTMQAGIAPFKVPILYGGGSGDARLSQAQARFIEFAKSPAEVNSRDLIKAYAEVVCACFGMTLGDLGLFGQELRLAGATKLMELSKRQGLAKVMRGHKTLIDNDVLPDGIEFKWAELDLEDELRKSQSKEISARRLGSLVTHGILPARLAFKAALSEELFPPDILEGEDIDSLFADEETQEEDVDITDSELGAESEPTGEGVAEDMEQRADDGAGVQAFPANSKWARRMLRLAERLLRPGRNGLTVARAKQLIEVGLSAFEKAETESRSWPSIDIDTYNRELLALVRRTTEEAREALDKALRRADWWKAPNLVDEVSVVLRGAYAEGAALAIDAIESTRVGLGLNAVNVSTTTFNLTNEKVLDLIRTRAGEFIRHIDDGTRSSIVNAIMRGVREGISSPQIARELLASSSRKAMVETFRNRTLSIVNTEINWAESHATLDQQVALGLTKKRWISIPGLACPVCQKNSARGSVDHDASFSSVFGSTQAPPAHPGVCHCYLTFDKEQLKSLGDDVAYWMGG